MAINVNPYSWYQDWNNVLPMLGIQYRESDDSQPGWFYQNPEEGSGRIHWGEDGPADPNLQYAPARLYEEALRQQGYVPTSLGDLGYYAQYGQYGDGQGFGGDVSKYLDYAYGPGWNIVNDPTHGFLIKPFDPAKAINGAGTPVALPNRSGSFGDFLKEAAPYILPVAAAAFAPTLAGAFGGGTTGAMGAGAAINAGGTALAGGNLSDIGQSAITGGALTGATSLLGGTTPEWTSGYDVPSMDSSPWTSGYDVPSMDNQFTYTADGGSPMPSSMDVSVTDAPDWTSGYDVPSMDGGNQVDWTSGFDVPSMDSLPAEWTSGYDLPMMDSGEWTSGFDLPSMNAGAGAPGSFNVGPGQIPSQVYQQLLGGAGLGGAGTFANTLAKSLFGSNPDGSTRSFFDAVGGNKGLVPSLLPAALGAYGANQQAQAYRDVSDKYMAMGAPFRQRLADSYGAGFKASDIPGYNEALDSASNAIMRKLSTTGNPFDNPGGLMEANRYVMENTALPAINNYRSQLGTFGQLGTSTGGTAALGAIPAAGGVYDAIGAGLYNATKEQDPFATTMAALYRSMLPGGNYKLNAGMGV